MMPAAGSLALDPTSLNRDAGEFFGSPAPAIAPLTSWLAAFETPDPEFRKALQLAYGNDAQLIAERAALYRAALNSFQASFGCEGKVFVLAVPSRINWEGHHVDQQGGHYNATTHSREMLFVVRRRTDQRVRLANANPERFHAAEFSLGHAARKDERRHVWSDYVRGAFEAVRRRFQGQPLLGADIAVASDIPVGASLSSSHALVLGSALCALGANGFRLDKREAVILVQQGEWFTGSRTGLGDQATMVFGRRGKLFCSPVIEQSGLCPRYVDIPEGYAYLIVDSFTEHHLQGEERIDYNARVFANRAAFPLVLAAMLEDGASREMVAATRQLVDIAPDRFPTDAIYRALKRLPEIVSIDDARTMFEKAVVALDRARVPLQVRDFDELVRTYFGVGPVAKALPVRGVALYGLAECWRS